MNGITLMGASYMESIPEAYLAKNLSGSVKIFILWLQCIWVYSKHVYIHNHHIFVIKPPCRSIVQQLLFYGSGLRSRISASSTAFIPTLHCGYERSKFLYPNTSIRKELRNTGNHVVNLYIRQPLLVSVGILSTENQITEQKCFQHRLSVLWKFCTVD